VPGEGAATHNRQPVPKIRRRPLDERETGENESGTTGHARDTSSHERQFQVIPVPDPEAGRTRRQTPSAPDLLDRQDRTARRVIRQAKWELAPIEWANRRSSTESQEPLAGTRPSACSAERVPDTSCSYGPKAVAHPAAARPAVPGGPDAGPTADTEGWHAVRD
jgi:hypothetical protein